MGDNVLLITGPALGPEGTLIDRARAGEVPLEIVNQLRRPVNPIRDWVSYLKIKNAIQRFQPDVVHTHSAKGGILGRAAAWSLGVPAIVHTVHGAPFHPYQSGAARATIRMCERWAAGLCHSMVSVADAMTDLLVENGVAPREKFTTLYSGMDVEPLLRADENRDRARSQLGYEPEHIVIGKIARLFRLKGHEYVIRAAKKVVQQNPNVRFLFVGDGTLRKTLQRQIKTAGLENYFQLVGLVPSEQIPELIGAMDIVVHASLREGLARVLPQSLVAGRPVVSYEIDGASEVVLPNRTGLLVPPKSIEQLGSALTRLANDSQFRRNLGDEGRQLFTDQFRHERMTSKLRSLYQKLLLNKDTDA